MTGLTDGDLEKLRDIAENGVAEYSKNGGGDYSTHRWPDSDIDGTFVTCHRCQYRWAYTGDSNWRVSCPACKARTHMSDSTDGIPRGITPIQCNTIREAAHDGKSYGEITQLFSFLTSRGAASRHARGKCQHGNAGIPPVENDRDGGFGKGAIGRTTCRALRRKWSVGDFDSYVDAGEYAGVHRTTAATHIKGHCKHVHGQASD